MIIDAHVHVFSDNVKENREKYFTDKNFKYLYETKNSRIVTIDDLVQTMQEEQVDKSLIVGYSWEKIEACKRENDYFLKKVSLYNDKIIPFAALPNNSNYDVDNYILSLHEQGFKGIGELVFYQEGVTDEILKYLENIFEIANKYNMIINLHLNEPVGHEYKGKYDPNLNKIYQLICKFPDLIIIMAHFGGGLFFYELMPEVKNKLKNVYYDISATPYLYESSIYKIALEIIGAEKIIFGSDFPLIKPGRYIKDLKQVVTNQLDYEKIMGKNIQQLLNLK